MPHLADVVKLDLAICPNTLRQAITVHLEALLAHSLTFGGQRQIMEVAEILPKFAETPPDLSDHAELAKLRRAGELVLPCLVSTFGGWRLTQSTLEILEITDELQIQDFLHVTHPLLISLLHSESLLPENAVAR
ncbi:hypothetical protein [Deinococcus xinjiangensis]